MASCDVIESGVIGTCNEIILNINDWNMNIFLCLIVSFPTYEESQLLKCSGVLEHRWIQVGNFIWDSQISLKTTKLVKAMGQI